jgi:tetratricopeptide (TPR) repeat protein
LVGLLLFLGLVIYIIVSACRQEVPPETTRKRARDEVPDFGRVVLPGLVCAVTAVLADNVFSTNLQNPSTAIYFWFLLGMLAGRCGPKREFSWNASRALWITAAVASYAMIVFFSYHRILSQVHLKKAIWAKEARRYEQAIADYRLACRINYYDYVSWYKLAYVYGETDRLNEAGEVYHLINVFLFPHFAKTDMNLGTIYLKAGKPEQALYYYRWAEWFNPYDEDVLCSVASIYLVCYNNVPEAKKYLERVIKIDPKNEYANRTLKALAAHPSPKPSPARGEGK